MTDDEKKGLGIAFNEATLLGLEVQPNTRRACATLSVLALPVVGAPPPDSRLQLLFLSVGRVAASLRTGRWDDPDAVVTTFAAEELLQVTQSFGGLPIYGWEFFDVPESGFERWSNRLSLDVRFEQGGVSHSMTVFQDGVNRQLNVRIWFDELKINDGSGKPVEIAEVIAAGKRWWDALFAKDKRTDGHGIIPCK